MECWGYKQILQLNIQTGASPGNTIDTFGVGSENRSVQGPKRKGPTTRSGVAARSTTGSMREANLPYIGLNVPTCQA
jgi:hypothetical protein